MAIVTLVKALVARRFPNCPCREAGEVCRGATSTCLSTSGQELRQLC
jgi:hypothetical protein